MKRTAMCDCVCSHQQLQTWHNNKSCWVLNLNKAAWRNVEERGINPEWPHVPLQRKNSERFSHLIFIFCRWKHISGVPLMNLLVCPKYSTAVCEGPVGTLGDVLTSIIWFQYNSDKLVSTIVNTFERSVLWTVPAGGSWVRPAAPSGLTGCRDDTTTWAPTLTASSPRLCPAGLPPSASAVGGATETIH